MNAKRADLIYATAGLIASLIVRAALRLRVYGAEHIPAEEPALLVANHCSHFDPVVISVIAHRRGRPVRLVAVQELFDKPVIGALVHAIGWIPVTPGRKDAAITAAKAALSRGDLVLIYPEGTIPAAGVIAPARPGAAAIAVGARVPTIPIASEGWRRDARSRGLSRRRVTVRIGTPIDSSLLQATAAETGYLAASELLLAAVRDLSGALREKAARD